ncbi:MAG TPA: hypothetical protein VLE43_17715 [Candidatus Saccharimonadia bacterium]|nr:hypothetical protein [Candidatus Saccharimonadia bacterium]
MAHPFENKFKILIRLAKLALLGIPLGVAAWFLPHDSVGSKTCAILATLALTPCFVFTYVLTILHWKSRYKGDHSDLWGVLLLLETTGWFKIAYLIRHLIPDLLRKGRYLER